MKEQIKASGYCCPNCGLDYNGNKAIAALEAAEARESLLRTDSREMAESNVRLIAENAELRAQVAELEGMVPCTKCSGNKVVSTTTNTFACLCLDPYGCALCKGAGQYEVTAITDCDQCRPLPAAPKEEV